MAGNIQRIGLCFTLFSGVCAAGFLLILVLTFPLAQIIVGLIYMHECPVAPVIPVYVMVFGIWALVMMASLALPKIFCPASPSHIVWIVWIIILSGFFFLWLLFGSYQIYSIYPPNYERNTTSSNTSSSSTYSQFSISPQNVLNLNQTMSISNNQTSGSLMQTLGLSSLKKKANGELLNGLNPQQMLQEHAAAPYCSRTVYLFAFWTTTLVYVAAGLILGTIICLCGFMEAIDKFVKYISF